MIKGTYHIGFGVTNDERSINFYQKFLNFGKVRVSIEDVSEGSFGAFVGEGAHYRWSMLTHNVGDVEFEPVQLLSRNPKPITENYKWGDIGFNDVCFKVEGLHKLYDQLREEGVKLLCPPQKMIVEDEKWGKEFFYIEDPDGINIKFEEDINNSKTKAKVLDYHYLCIGVTDLKASLRFYGEILGYHRVLWNIEGHLEWMDEVCGERVYGHSVMLGSDFDECLLQLVQVSGRGRNHIFKDKNWGDVGLLEFCLRVYDLEKTCDELRKKNVRILVEPTLATPKLDYAFIAYVADPDGNYVEFSFHKKKS